MKKSGFAVVLVLGLFLLSSVLMVGRSMAQDAFQAKCPVMGLQIDKKVYADAQGKRVHFCCASCIEKFKADPDGYIKKLESQGVKLPKADS